MSERTGWRVDALLREAVVSATTSGARARLMLTTAVLVGVMLAGLQLNDWRSLTQQIRAADVMGRSVVTLSAPPQGSAEVATRSCEGLISLGGVEAAGVVISDGRSSYAQLGTGIATARASSTLIPELRAADLAIGSALETGTEGTLTSPSGDVLSYERVAPQPAGIDVNSTVLSPLRKEDSTALACIVRLSSFARVEDYVPLLLSSLQSTGSPLVARTFTEAVDPISAYSSRITSWAPVVGGLVCALLGLIMLFTRGSEIAAYRMSGTSIREVLAIRSVEQALYAAVLWCSATLAMIPMSGFLGTPIGVGAAAGIAAFTWVVVYPLGAVLFLRRDPTALARDR